MDGLEDQDRADSRQLATPRQDRSTTRQSRSRSRRSFGRRSRSRSRCRSHRLREREQDLKRERERLHHMERALQIERDAEFRSRRSEQHQHTSRRDPLIARSEHRDPLGASDLREQRGDCSRRVSRDQRRSERRKRDASTGRRSRSCSPSFTSKDICKIIQSFKSHVPSHPPEQNAQSNNKLDYKNILPEFDPSTKNQRMDVWLRKVNECASVYGWDGKTTIHFAMQKLQGLAKTWYQSLNTILFTWAEWQEKLLKAFPCEQNYGQSLEDMLRRKSRFNEPIENYFYEKLALLNQCEIMGKRAVDCIIHGLSDKTVKSSALALRCSEPDQLLQFLLSNKESSYQAPFRNKPNYDNPNSIDNSQQYNRPYTRSSGNTGLFCYNCKEKGHPYLKCTKPLLKCDRCNRIGHKSDNCPIRQEAQSTKATTVPKTMCISNSSPNDKFIKEVTIGGVPLEAFVDFGSEVTLIGESSVAKLGVAHDGISSVMKGFGNGLVHSLGSVTLGLVIDGVAAVVVCKVVEDHLLDKPMLVGQTYSEQPHIVVFKNATKLQFLDVGTEIPTQCYNDEVQSMRVRLTGRSKLYGAASVRAATESIFTGNILLDTKIVGKPNEQYIVLGGIYQVKNGFLNVMVTPCSIPCVLQENSVFSRAEKIDVVNRVVSTSPEPIIIAEPPKINKIDRNQIQLGDLVSEETKAKLLKLLQSYEHCFAFDLTELGCTDITEMKIDLNRDHPVVYRPYRLSHHERDKVRSMVDEMLEAGIIRESVSNYASPIILVRKKDGKIRMCVDYRMLNSITVKERYPMPVIEDEISRLSGQAWFITLDLMSGYYQVPIAEQHKHLTAFVTPDGQYEFNRMPFGLANAPAVFQRMMNHVLGSARFNKATVYIDDLLIYGKNPDEALTRLEEVLQLLTDAKLKLNLSKCSFLQNQINYLGYEISSTGMRPGEAKIRCVAEFPQPGNVHAVRQFLGLVSYFRKFINGFAELAYPLTKLLKKDVKWEWTHDQEKAFNALKTRLITRPVLAIYDHSAETELHTDASRMGIGGILLQRSQGSDMKPVAYYSRQTTPEEKNFHSYELETLAVICALKKFRVFVLGKEFKVVTDCSALRSTFLKRDLIPRIARWWLALQEFDCTVEYRAGTKMAHADALSRNPVTDPDAEGAVQYPSILAISNEDWLLTLQLGDTELGRIRDVVNSDLDSKGLEYIKENYTIRDNKLFRCLDGDKTNVRWVVPKGARWQVCKMNHDDIGHVGFEKTLERIKRLYWFSKMSRFIKKYVGSCIECAYAKKTATTREGLLHPIAKVETPFHTLHIDHLGPFVKSKRGHTHILVVVDSFTKFVFIKPVRNTKTFNVIKVLDDIFDTFRSPDRLVSDRGSCFTSHAFKRFCLDKGVRHILNAVASPRSNGQVERYNRTILDSLTAQNLKHSEKDWDNKLGKIQWGLNNTLQKTIGKAPAEVMFGTLMNSESNPALNEITDVTRKTCDLSSLREEVKGRIDSEQQKQKQYYDKGRRPARIYSKGDLVKITKTAFQNDGKSTKLLPSYEGPFRVVKVLGNDRYKVAPIPGFEGMKTKRKTTVASDRMQPWIHMASLTLDSDSESLGVEIDNDARTMDDKSDDEMLN